jgi:hypothetical protein
MIIQKTTTKSFKVLHVKGDILTFDERYRNIRKNMKYRGFGCFNCSRKFKDGERFGLIITDKGNKTVCNECVDKISKELEVI